MTITRSAFRPQLPFPDPEGKRLFADPEQLGGELRYRPIGDAPEQRDYTVEDTGNQTRARIQDAVIGVRVTPPAAAPRS